MDGAEKVAAAAAEAVDKRKRFTDADIAAIRADRALKNEAGGAQHSHKSLAEKYDTTAGTISQIVRNRVYKNPDYVAVNDGK